jgi:hypothetical protein
MHPEGLRERGEAYSMDAGGLLRKLPGIIRLLSIFEL